MSSAPATPEACLPVAAAGDNVPTPESFAAALQAGTGYATINPWRPAWWDPAWGYEEAGLGEDEQRKVA